MTFRLQTGREFVAVYSACDVRDAFKRDTVEPLLETESEAGFVQDGGRTPAQGEEDLFEDRQQCDRPVKARRVVSEEREAALTDEVLLLLLRDNCL